jgi:WD40 repeat protein
MSKIALLLVTTLVTGCGKEATGLTDVDAAAVDPDAPGTTPGLTELERCFTGGGSPAQLFMESNQHGPVTSITVNGSSIVLGSADGSVKQWTVSSSAIYGQPFTQNAGSVVGALANTRAKDILGVDAAGVLHRWTLADAGSEETMTIGANPLVAVGVNGNASRAAVGEADVPNLRVIDLDTGTPSAPLTTTLWGVTSFAFTDADVLIDAGHNYGTPQVERRSVASPMTVVDQWNDQTLAGSIRAIALDAGGTTLVAVGDGMVMTFDPMNLAGGPRKITMLPEHLAVGVVLLAGRSHFLTVGSEGTLRVWDVATASLVKTLTVPTPIGIGADIDGTQVYTSGPDGFLHSYGCGA